jgi:predicted secreted protein
MTELKAKLHKPFEIALGSQAMSGYEWRPQFDRSALKFLGRRRTGNLRQFGASGKEVFRFEALQSGDYEVSFELIRPFENSSVETRNFALHIE